MSPSRMRGAVCFQRRITPLASRYPAQGQPLEQPGQEAQAHRQHGGRLGQRTAPVQPLRLVPAQGGTGTSPFARQHHAQRAGLCQAAQPTPVARRTFGGFGRRFGLQVNDLVSMHTERRTAVRIFAKPPCQPLFSGAQWLRAWPSGNHLCHTESLCHNNRRSSAAPWRCSGQSVLLRC